MSTIDEKRVYSDSTEPVAVYVGSSMGVVRVKVSGSLIGEFSLCHQRTVRDIDSGPGVVAVATDTDVLVADVADDPEAFAETGFGTASAVGYDGDTLVAAGTDGRIERRRNGDWERLEAEFDADVRAIDGDLIGTERGVYRVHDGRVVRAGLENVRDVSAPGVPLAATGDGLYKLGNGWMESREGAFDVVVADPISEPGSIERAHAVGDAGLLEYADDEWDMDSDIEEHGASSTGGPIVDVGYGETAYAITAAGTVLAADDSGWRSRSLGIGETVGLAVPRLSSH